MEKRNPKLANSLYFDAPDARVSSSHRVGVPIEVVSLVSDVSAETRECGTMTEARSAKEGTSERTVVRSNEERHRQRAKPKGDGSESLYTVRVSVTPRTDDRCPGRARTRPCPSFLQHYALRTKLESPAVSACAPHARLGSRVCVSSTSTRSCTLPPAPSPGGTRGTLNKIAPASATPTLNRSFVWQMVTR